MTKQVIELETDYLVVGAGAVGMAFVDVFVSKFICWETLERYPY